ncbi:TPA: arylamine N-acetyltransferase [Burkholderia vietnamiensis]|nr:arylamine N-acetyltransferase [Burkholderia vietnamiensis]
MKFAVKKIILYGLLAGACHLAQAQEVRDIQTYTFDSAHTIKPKGVDFRMEKLEKAISEHEAHKPKNWDQLVYLVKIQNSDYDKVAMANIIANQLPYIDGTDGSYMAPQTALERGGVVCKDYAMFKYLLLREAGFDTHKMFLTVIQSALNPVDGAHVFLTVDIDGKKWIANQFWASTANQFYASYKINPQKLSKNIKKNGIAALQLDAPLDSLYNKKSLTLAQNYGYADLQVIWLGNENGVYVEKPVMPTMKKKNKKDKS